MDSVYPNLSAELSKANICVAQLAEALNLTEAITYDKLRGDVPWLLREVMVICQLIDMYNVKFLFLRLV